MYRKYYSYNDMPHPISEHAPFPEPIPQPMAPARPKPPPPPINCQEETQICNNEKNNSFLGNLETDDIILGVIILMLLTNDCDDKLLLLAIAFIFFSGFSF